MSGEEVRKGGFAESFDVDALVKTENTEAGEEEHPIGDGCDAFIRRNGGVKGKGNDETGRGDGKTPIVVYGDE